MVRSRSGSRALLAGALAVAAAAACSGGAGRSAERPGRALVPSAASASSSPPGVVPAPSSAATVPAPAGPAGDDWPTFGHDPLRSGTSPDPAPAGDIHRLWASPVLDGKVYGQALLAGGRVIVATEGDSVYSLSADTGAVLWRARLGDPVDGSTLPCGNVSPSGVTGTPVLGPGGAIDVVAFLRQGPSGPRGGGAGPHHELFTLDAATGALRAHRPVDPPGLAPRVEQQRGALTLDGGRVLVPFGGLFGDCGPYKGAVVGVPADGGAGGQSFVVPTTREGGIWNPGGTVVDERGDVWLTTGNTSSTTGFDDGNAVLHLTPDLRVVDFFAPANWAALNDADADLGSTTPVLLSPTRVFAIGKEGRGFILDRNALGHVGGARFAAPVCAGSFGTAVVASGLVVVPCSDGLVALRPDAGDDRFDVAWREAATSAGSPAVAGGLIWSIDGQGGLTAADPATGTVRFRAALGPVNHFASPSAAAGRVVAPAGKHVIAFALR